MSVDSVVYPTAAVRTMIEGTANDGGLSPSARARELGLLRDELKLLVGQCEQRLGEAKLQETAEDFSLNSDYLAAREAADIRDEMVRRGLATPEQMDALGYFSHGDIDRKVIDEYGLQEASALGILRGFAFNVKHPRGRGGRWIDVADHPDVGKMVPGGGRIKRVLRDKRGNEHRVYETRKATGGEIVDAVEHGVGQHPSLSPLAHSQLHELKTGMKRGEHAASREDLPEDAHPSVVTATKEGLRQRAYDKRQKRLAKRAQRATERETKQGVDPEIDLNPNERVGQSKLLSVVRAIASDPTTAEMHGKLREDGTIEWDADRRDLHARIIDVLLRERDDKGNLCASCPYLPAQEIPEVMFSGGGYAAGKGTITRGREGPNGEKLPSIVPVPGQALTIDPDVIKSLLPEFHETLEGDPEANLRVYEEAWDLSQQLQKVAQARKLNVVVDGITDTSPDEVFARVQSFQDAGYQNPVINYVDIPTEEALRRAAHRAKKAKKASDRRHIPEIIMRAVHRDLGATIPSVLNDERVKEMGLTVRVFDNAGPEGQEPTLIAEADPETGPHVRNEFLWSRLANKGLENIGSVTDEHITDGPPAPVRIPEPVHGLVPVGAAHPGTVPGEQGHAAYFELGHGTRIVPVERLKATKEESAAESVSNAIGRMLAAARGNGARRPPLTVEANDDGTFTVVDGNATLEAAKELGWTDLPVQVVGPQVGRGLRPGLPRRDAERALINAIDANAQSGDHRQPSDKLDEVYALGEQHIGPFSDMLEEFAADMGGVSTTLLNGQAFPRSHDAAVANVEQNSDTLNTIIGAIKDRAKAELKVNGKYDGDASDLSDVVRGSVVVPLGGQLEQGMEELATRLRERGWKIVDYDNRYAEDPGNAKHGGPFGNGYADVNVLVEGENGFKMEVQIHTVPMWLAKERRGHHMRQAEAEAIKAQLISGTPPEAVDRIADLSGHDWYDIVTITNRRAEASGRRLTGAQHAVQVVAQTRMEALYRQALEEAYRPTA